jgi:DNA-binding response OmpR family regulator
VTPESEPTYQSHRLQRPTDAALRILFVEKDITTADLLVPSLERKGHRVAVASTQRQAMSQIRTLHPNLLVVDVASFGLKGYEVYDVIRAKLPGAPTVLLLEEGHQAAGGAGEAFMTPPFTSRKLLYRIRVAAEQITFRQIEAGSLALDVDSRVLCKGRHSWQLRPKEAAVLELLMRNAGTVVSRRQIMKQVWETDYIGDTRTLSVHICWLRQKIEDDPKRPRLLRTVRGVGYCLKVPPR